jgi:ABC-type transport system involved in multi-copper enzyme maturation permease subunit
MDVSIGLGLFRSNHERPAPSRARYLEDTMTATLTTTTHPATRTTGSLTRTGIAAAAVASAATMTIAAVGHAAGISLDMSGEPIPVTGFGVLTAVFSLVGLVLAVVLSRTARSPRTAFIRTTVVLTALSLVPDAIADAAPATKALLMCTHLVAAAIVVPAVARRLAS